MLRVLIVFLLVANAMVFAWGQGYLTFAGLGPGRAAATDETVQTTLHADWLRPLTAGELQQLQSEAAAQTEPPPVPPPWEAGQQQTLPVPQQGLPAAAPAPLQCMQVAGLGEEQAAALRTPLQDFAPSLWRFSQTTQAGRWMVLWGGVNDELLVDARVAGLQQRQLPYERLRTPPHGPGISLGRFSSEAGAQQQQQNLGQQQGITDTQIVLERPPAVLHTLTFPDYAAVRARVSRELAVHWGANSLQPC